MEKFDELIQEERPVLVDFFATWCGPCQRMHPILESLKAQLGEQVRIVKVDIDQHPEIADRYGVQSIPTLMIFQQGEQKWSFVGATTEGTLKRQLTPYLK
jgi:thioredoxin 1